MSKDKPKDQKPIVPICGICNQPLTVCRCKYNKLKK